jgi:hypothetical protein
MYGVVAERLLIEVLVFFTGIHIHQGLAGLKLFRMVPINISTTIIIPSKAGVCLH